MNIITMNNISKYFSVNNTLALDKMHIEVEEGEIHAIVGENGAGKSTLMKILHNIEKCDSGEITISGKTGMVSQHFRLIEELTILDNIIIGVEPTHFGFLLDREKGKKRLEEILTIYGFYLDVDQKVRDLSIGQKQLVEIIKVIFNNSDILIFDEPTSALSEIEAQKLRKTILSLKRNGKTIIIISHKIKDISSISDRFTIMRKGKFIETVNTKSVNLNDISRHMSGTDIIKTIIDTTNPQGEPLFEFIVDNVDVTVHEREIIGITGYGDCGLHRLEEGLEKMSLGLNNIGYVPSDRLTKGVELNSKLKETLIAKDRKSFSKHGVLNSKKIDSFSRKLIDKYNIKGSINAQTGTLSGGNLQKSVLARVLEQDPKILILCSPTWGIDLESSNNIYRDIKSLKQRDRGILLLSSDVDEILKLSNRVFVMYKGEVIKELKNDKNCTPELIGRLSSGITHE
ncbi:ATP-binding cassette domain-containing protein [Thiospirochaeta perfilievii]|uniref:ATP-binding cassette domain-containing protein n=1 Tax=Thiospirochaeta perfilievii TaxID=252967 RepID=A0A5C1QCG8_9SPIO|nr:ATP-binding cassette domain-containing protein [Thiospirochaeta perfilievii]QEN05028.1 ATP-binding cassette domain-containing protein [Thiospirochaeta perfilievii]